MSRSINKLLNSKSTDKMDNESVDHCDKTPDFSVILTENFFKGLISDILEKIDISLIENLVKEEKVTEKMITIIEALWTKWHQSGDQSEYHFSKKEPANESGDWKLVI